MKNNILEDYFLNINNKEEINKVSENKSESFLQEKKCGSSERSSAHHSIPVAPSACKENLKEVSPDVTDFANNSDDDEDATKAQVSDEDTIYTSENEDIRATEDNQNKDVYSTRIRLERRRIEIDEAKIPWNSSLNNIEDIDKQNIACSSGDICRDHNNQTNKHPVDRNFKTVRSRSLEKKGPFQDRKEQGNIGTRMKYHEKKDVSQDKGKQVPYNLRPGRSIQSNKRYFNETYDYSSKRRKTKFINPYCEIPAQPQQSKYKPDFHSQKTDEKIFQECNYNVEEIIQSSTNSNANDKHLFTKPRKDKTHSESSENSSIQGSLFHPKENGNDDETVKHCSTNADHKHLTKRTKHKEEMPFKDNITFSDKTIASSVDTSLLGPFFEKKVPKSGHFYISEEKWENLKASQKGRCFSNSNWEDIICDGIKDTNPFCVYMFKWHKVSIATERLSSSKPAFSGEGICKFEDCKNNLKFAMDRERKVTYSMSPQVKHDITQNFSRPFRGDRRQQLQEKFQDGPKPFKCYMDKFISVDNEIKLAGNFSEFGNSPKTFQKIASESRFTHTLEKSDFESLLRVSEKMIQESTAKRLPGFIRHISIYPPIIMYWSEAGVRIWHDMAKDSTVFWDATGSVISPRKDRPQFYYHEMACLNPTKGQNIIPVTSLLSTLHSTPMIRFWISEFRRAEKKLYGHGNIAMPKQVNSDRSLVFIQAALSEFNNERAWRIINGEASVSDMTKVNPHACLSHVMSSFKKIVKTVYKTNSEFGMFCFSLILNSNKLNTMKENLESVYQVLLSKTLDQHTENELKKINEKLSKLSLESSNDIEVSVDDEVIETDSIFPEFAHASKLTEEDYLNRSTTNAFYNMSHEILQKVKEKVSTNLCLGTKENRFHSTTLVEKIHKLYMPTVPLWSNLLLGDVSRHGVSQVYQSYASENKSIRGNTSIEKRFQVLKNITLGGKPVHRLDEFSVQLRNHVETLQNMAVIKNIKSGGKERKGRSTKTIEEEWDKKQPKLPSTNFGKYQVPPKKGFSGNVSGKKKEDMPTNCKTKVSENTLKKDNHHHPEAKALSSRKESSKQSLQMLLYSHNCDHEITRLIRSKGCIAQRHIVFPKSSETIKREDKFIFENAYGLSNIGNSCWFNAVLSALIPTDIMQISLDRYNKEMTFCPVLQKTLCIINNLYNEVEIPNTEICEALEDLQEAFQINVRGQNDAHEFLTTFLSILTRSLNCRNMRIREVITCLSCGNVTIREEDTTCLTLSVPSNDTGIDTVCVQDLLEDFFKDENIEGARCDTCESREKYKKCVPVFFPDTIILSLQRYKVNKWDNIEKDRMDINPDNFINFKKYTTRDDELIYKLESVVMHKGRQPTSGHYTALRKAIDSFVLIDDDRVQMYHGDALKKDGYLLIYSSLKISESTFIYMCCCCIANSGIYSSLDFQMSKKVFTSPMKREIKDRFQNLKITTDLLPEDGKLMYLIHNSKVKVRRTVEYIQDVVNYLLAQYPNISKNIIGFDVLQYFCCENCHEIVGETKHLLELNQNDIDLFRKGCYTIERDCICGKSMTGKQIISNIGNTILLQSSYGKKAEGLPSLDWVLSGVADVIFPGVLFKFRVSVCFLPQEPSVIIFSKEQCMLLDNCEEVTKLSEHDLINITTKNHVVLLCDKIEEQITERNMYSKEPGDEFPNMFGYEIMDILSLNLDQTTEKMLIAFPCGISHSRFNLDCNQVESFLRGWYTDLHIDLFLSSLGSNDKNENCIMLPCSWFQNMRYEKIPHQTYKKWTENFVIIPVNLRNRHWVLIVLSMRQKCIIQLDPLGGFDEAIILQLQRFIRIQIFLHSGEEMGCDQWIVKDAGTSTSFPKQSDSDSCGAYVCLYASLLCKKAVLNEVDIEKDFKVRQFILHELLEKTFFLQHQPFGLKEVLLLKNIDELAQSIASADVSDTGEQLARHKIFLQSPVYYHEQYLINFGGGYFTAGTFDIATRYLQKRYILEKTHLFKKEVIFRDIPKESKLNQVFASNWTYGAIYIRDVLVKEILIEILGKHLSVNYKTSNKICTKSEMSFLNEKRNKLRQQREGRLDS